MLRLACLSPLGFQTFDIEPLFLVLPTTDYLRKVPVSIGTTITDLVVDFINQNKPDNVSTVLEGSVLCHTFKEVGASTTQACKRSIKTTKPIILPPFNTTIVKGNTKFRSHGMRLNPIAESSSGNQLPSGVHSVPQHTALWSLAPAGFQ